MKGRTPLFDLDLATGAIQVATAVGHVDAFEISPDGTWAVLARRQMHLPTELWQVALAGKAPGTTTPLTFQNQALLAEVDFRPMEEVYVDSPSGKKIQVLLVKPHGFDPAKKYPVIVNVHGGPQMQWADAFRGDAQVYPGAGYVVAFPNPHGSTGWGQDFTAAISGDWDGKVMKDVLAVTDWLAVQPWADKDRIGAMGWSWGGYAMMWLAGNDDHFKALASMMGVYDLRSMYSMTEELWFPEWDLKGTPWQNPEGYAKQSPSSYVEKFKTPTLVDHRPEGLPRPLHAVARLLHRPAEDGRPVAPRSSSRTRATGPAGTTWSSTTPPTSTGSTGTSAALRRRTTRRPSWRTTSSGRRRRKGRRKAKGRCRSRPAALSPSAPRHGRQPFGEERRGRGARRRRCRASPRRRARGGA